MSFTYDFDTAPLISYPRFLISDTSNVAPLPVFQDAEVMAAYVVQQNVWQSAQFYSPPAGAYAPSLPVSYYRVASILLCSMAANKAKLASIRRILDVELDPSKAAQWLMSIAKEYEEKDENSASLLIVEQVNNDASLISRYWKQVQRQQGVPF